jgi:hypothetical protein
MQDPKARTYFVMANITALYILFSASHCFCQCNLQEHNRATVLLVWMPDQFLKISPYPAAAVVHSSLAPV